MRKIVSFLLIVGVLATSAPVRAGGVPPLLVLDSTLQGHASTASPLGLAPTTVTAGTYTSTNLTVDADGRITAAANGTSGGVTGSGTTGDLTAWASSSSVGNYAGSSPSACTTGKAITGIAISAAGVITPTCTAIGGATIATTSAVLKGDGAGNGIASGVTDNGTTVGTSEALSTSGGIANTGGLTTDALSVGVIAPTAITGTVNDWAPTGIAGTMVVQVNESAGTILNGIVAPSTSRELCLQNVSTFSLSIANQAAASVAANRFATVNTASWVLTSSASQAACFYYDTVAARWTQLGTYTFPQLAIGAAATVNSAGNATFARLAATGISGQNSGNFAFASTAQAGSFDAMDVTNSGTFNATAAVRTAGGINVAVTATRSTGSNNLTNVAADFTASGAQVNQALVTDLGDVELNRTGGAFKEDGLSEFALGMQFDSTLSQSGTSAITFGGNLTSTAAIKSATLESTGSTQVDGVLIAAGHVRSTGLAVTVTNISACGASPAVSATATDTAGVITFGASATTSCTLTFNTTYSTAPTCVCSSNAVGTAGLFVGCSTTATTLVATGTAGTSIQKFSYICVGS